MLMLVVPSLREGPKRFIAFHSARLDAAKRALSPAAGPDGVGGLLSWMLESPVRRADNHARTSTCWGNSHDSTSIRPRLSHWPLHVDCLLGDTGSRPAQRRAHHVGRSGLWRLGSTWQSDYPHADRTEGTAQHLNQRDDIPETVRRKLLEDNARRFYNL